MRERSWTAPMSCYAAERSRALLRPTKRMGKSKGNHRRVTNRQRTIATAATVSVLALAALPTGVAYAAPQGGVTTPGAGGEQGTQTQNNGGGQAGVSTPKPNPAPTPPEERTYWVPPSQQAQQAPSRPIPTTSPDADYSPPLQQQTFRPPTAVPTVAPIEAPVDEKGEQLLRAGDRIAKKPNWMTDQVLDTTNYTLAGWESDASGFWRSVGVDDNRSDRVAASMVSGAAVGAVVTAVPFAIAGGALGGPVGVPFGAAVTQAILPFAPGIAAVPGATVGYTAGAAGGAALGGAIGLVVGGVGGAITGGLIGGGEATDDELVLTELPQLPDPDPVQITKDVSNSAQGLASTPAGAGVVQAIADAPANFEHANEQFRQTVVNVAGQPALDVIDQAATAHAEAVAPINAMLTPFTDRINTAVGAAQQGIDQVIAP